jgi:hypothetical protein
MTIKVLSTVMDKPHPYRFNEVDNWLPFEPYEISISSDGLIWHSVYDEPSLKDVYCYKADIDKANPVDTLRTFAGTDGQTVDSTRYETRNITLHFVGKTKDVIDTDLAADSLSRFFADRKPYWVVIAGKYGRAFERWLVRPGQLKVNQADENWTLIDVPLVNLSGYAQSVVNSVEFESDPEAYGGIGMGLVQEMGTYTQTATSFRIYNPSDVEIDPLQQHHDLTITLSGVGKPTLTNNTNDTSFAFTKALTATDTLKIVKVNPYLNGTQDGLDSNHGWIQLNRGWNDFTLTGLSNPKAIFDFAWYFLS